MNDISDAKPNDIFVDENGKLWRVISILGEPSATVQEIEPIAKENPMVKSGGINGLMWEGFKRIYRKMEGEK